MSGFGRYLSGLLAGTGPAQRNYRVEDCGMLRCCLASLREVDGRGQCLRCAYCGELLLKGYDGVWRWDRGASRRPRATRS